VGGNLEGTDNGVEGLVDALDDLAEIALMDAGVGAGIEFAIDGGLRKRARVANQRLDRVGGALVTAAEDVAIGFGLEGSAEVAGGHFLEYGGNAANVVDESAEGFGDRADLVARVIVDGLIHVAEGDLLRGFGELAEGARDAARDDKTESYPQQYCDRDEDKHKHTVVMVRGNHGVGIPFRMFLLKLDKLT